MDVKQKRFGEHAAIVKIVDDDGHDSRRVEPEALSVKETQGAVPANKILHWNAAPVDTFGRQCELLLAWVSVSVSGFALVDRHAAIKLHIAESVSDVFGQPAPQCEGSSRVTTRVTGARELTSIL